MGVILETSWGLDNKGTKVEENQLGHCYHNPGKTNLWSESSTWCEQGWLVTKGMYYWSACWQRSRWPRTLERHFVKLSEGLSFPCTQCLSPIHSSVITLEFSDQTLLWKPAIGNLCFRLVPSHLWQGCWRTCDSNKTRPAQSHSARPHSGLAEAETAENAHWHRNDFICHSWNCLWTCPRSGS